MPMSWEQYLDGEERAAMGAHMALMVKAILIDNDAEDFADLNHDLYKYTDCGASLGLRLWDGSSVWNGDPRLSTVQPGDVEGIAVGSIVEGVDEVVEHDFIHPQDFFDKGEDDIAAFVAAYDALVEQVEDAAREIWDRTHGCDDCGPDDGWGRPINPECKSCGGEGTIL